MEYVIKEHPKTTYICHDKIPMGKRWSNDQGCPGAKNLGKPKKPHVLARKERVADHDYAVSAEDLEAYQQNVVTKQKFYCESGESWIAMDTMKKNYLAG